MSGATIELRFESPAAEGRFIREYLTDAWERFESSEYWESGWFWRYGQFAAYESGPDGGLVRVVFDGDPETLVDHESGQWDAFDGLSSWSLTRYEQYDSLLEQQIDSRGELGGAWEYRMKPLLARFALTYYREFEEQLPAVGDDSEANPLGIGFWSSIHNLLVQCGYNWYDETALCQKALQNRLKSIASYRGAEAAREEYHRLRDEWRAYEAELETWLDENPTGQASEP